MSRDKSFAKSTSGYGYQIRRITVRGINYIKRNGLFAAFRRMSDKSDKNRLYDKWRNENTLGKDELEKQRANASKLIEELSQNRPDTSSDSPMFSVVIPLYRTAPAMLRALIDSWLAQTYMDFEICLADASCDEDFEILVKDIIKEDPRVRYKRLGENNGISSNTNAAIEMSGGEFIVFCDHDDLVEPDALYRMAKVVADDPLIDVIYTDQDKIDSVGRRYYDPFIKPDYDPYLLCSTNYVCHLHAIRKKLLDEAGYLDPAFDGSQDYEVTLRVCEKARAIAHIPSMAYHWRISGSSTADEGGSKLYAYDAGKRAIEEHYKRLGIKAQVSMKEDTYGVYHTYFELSDEWEKNIITVATKDGLPDIKALSEILDDRDASENLILFRAMNDKKQTDVDSSVNHDTLRELAGYVIAAGANGCGAVADYPFELPPSGMTKVDISTFYLTVCPNENMPVKTDLLLVKASALTRDLAFYGRCGWQKNISHIVYNPFALPEEPIRI